MQNDMLVHLDGSCLKLFNTKPISFVLNSLRHIH